MSNQFIYQVLKNLALALYPEDITFLNDNKKYTIKEYMESQHLRQKLIPGDLVLTQTPGPIHSTIRGLAHFRYDHLAIIIDDENMLHIAPPYIRLLSSNILLMKKRNPLVIRVNLSEDERKTIIKALLKDIGERYDYAKVLGMSIRVFGAKMLGFYNEGEKSILEQSKSNICSDLIAYTLMEHSLAFKELVKKHFKKLDVSQYKSFSPDDFWKLSELDDAMVSKIHEAAVSHHHYHIENKKMQPSHIIGNVFNGLLLYKRVKANINKQKATTPFGKAFIIFKYMFIHDLIPYQKEALIQLLPVNVKFIQFVLVLLQIRQYYYDTILEQPSEVIKKLFPSFFLVANKLLGHRELDLIIERLRVLKKFKIKDLTKLASSGSDPLSSVEQIQLVNSKPKL